MYKFVLSVVFLCAIALCVHNVDGKITFGFCTRFSCLDNTTMSAFHGKWEAQAVVGFFRAQQCETREFIPTGDENSVDVKVTTERWNGNHVVSHGSLTFRPDGQFHFKKLGMYRRSSRFCVSNINDNCFTEYYCGGAFILREMGGIFCKEGAANGTEVEDMYDAMDRYGVSRASFTNINRARCST